MSRGCGGLLALLWVALAAVGAPPATSPYQPVYNPAGGPAAPAVASPLDQPLQLLAEANRTFQGIRDYTCLFVRREQIRGQLTPENLVAMRVRTQPFSIYMRWLAPAEMAGQEACYVAGRNNGMMRVHASGFRGVAGFVSLAPNDPRIMEKSRHQITEAGIANLLVRYGERWETERRLNKTQVRVAEYEYNKRKCMRVEMLHPDNSGREFLFYRCVVYFDKEHHLPVRVENYDWPRQGGNPQGDLVESYSYVDLRFNVGLGEEAFNY